MIYSLQGFRVLLCALIFLFHVNSQVEIQIPLFYGIGTLAVSYFFVLSGFVHGLTFDESKTFEDNRKKILSRIFSNYPLHWICLFLMIPLKFKASGINFDFITRFFVNASLLQAWLPFEKYNLDFNGASWFLSDIVFMLLMTVPLCKLTNKIKSLKILFLSILGIQCIEIFLSILFCDKDSNRILYYNPLIRLMDYFAGILVANFVKNYGREIRLKNIYESFVIILIVVLSFIYNYIPKSFTNAGTLYLLPACFSIYILSTQNGFISKFFCNRIFVNLAKGTMYFYMIHQVVNIYFKAVILHLRRAIPSYLCYTVVGGGSILAAFILYKVFNLIKNRRLQK